MFASFSDDLQAEVQVRLEDVITKQVQANAQKLLEQYKAKIIELSSEVPVGDIEVSPFALINGDLEALKNSTKLVNSLVKKETIVIEESHWVENSSKKWYKPWTWFQESGHWTDEITEQREYIDGSELAKRFFAPIQKQLFTNSKNAVEYAQKQTAAIKKEFHVEFDKLDAVLQKKFRELKACATEADNTDLLIKQTTERLTWLVNIQKEIESILEI